jgi:hypothetical protein
MAPEALSPEYLIAAALLALASVAGGTAWFRRHRRVNQTDKLFAALRAAHAIRQNAPPQAASPRAIPVEEPLAEPAHMVLTQEEPPMHLKAVAANEETI